MINSSINIFSLVAECVAGCTSASQAAVSQGAARVGAPEVESQTLRRQGLAQQHLDGTAPRLLGVWSRAAGWGRGEKSDMVVKL